MAPRKSGLGMNKAGELIMQVLAEKISIQDAIKHFPRDEECSSLECAFHALLHYEADEDYRKHDPDYAEEQAEHLEGIACSLKNGEPLPLNIIQDYGEYYEKAPVLSKKGFKNIFKNLFRLTV